MVEYEACAMGITMALEHHVKELKVFRDSALLCGEYETCDAKLILYHNQVTEMSEHFDKITFSYIPWDENQMVDALATLSSMLQDEAKADNQPWYHDIKKYLEGGAYLSGATENDKRTLRRLALASS
ncbi:hypothetical protein CR513_53135, partial [Mucuna pruriens]